MEAKSIKKIPLLCNGKNKGEATMERESLYTRLCVHIPWMSGIWLAWLVGESGEMRIGVLEPLGGQLTISRRFSQQSLMPLGKLLHCELRRNNMQQIENREHKKGINGEKMEKKDESVKKDVKNIGEAKKAKKWTRGTGRLFRDAQLQRQLKNIKEIYILTEENKRFFAFPVDIKSPFPLPAVFCFARLEKINDREYWVFAFNQQELPVL